jgi:hypothetical protein
VTIFINVQRLRVSYAKFSFPYIQIIAEINFLFLPPPPVKGYVAKQFSFSSQRLCCQTVLLLQSKFMLPNSSPPVKGYVAKQFSLNGFHSLHLHAAVTSHSNCLLCLSHYIYLDFSSSVFFVLFVHISLHLMSHQSICIKLMKQRSMVPLHQRQLWELFTMGGE